MRKVFAALILTVLMASAALADVLYLKDGSVLKGSFIGYENGKFIFETGGNRLEFRPDQVSRLVVERDDYRPTTDRRPTTGRRPPNDPSEPPYSPSDRREPIRTFDVKLEDQSFRWLQFAHAGRARPEFESGTTDLRALRRKCEAVPAVRSANTAARSNRLAGDDRSSDGDQSSDGD